MIKLKVWMVFGILVANAVGASSNGYAADSAQRYAVRGAGAQSCERVLSFFQQKPEQKRDAILIYDAWFAGYVTHVNRSSEGTYDISPIVNSTDSLNLLLQQCSKNPKMLVESVVAGILVALSDAKVSEESQLVEVSVGEEKRLYRRETIVKIQQKLIDLKFLKERADGVFGLKSAKALAEFQKEKKIGETGFPDLGTVLNLLLVTE
jgi:hypothetical protein